MPTFVFRTALLGRYTQFVFRLTVHNVLRCEDDSERLPDDFRLFVSQDAFGRVKQLSRPLAISASGLKRILNEVALVGANCDIERKPPKVLKAVVIRLTRKSPVRYKSTCGRNEPNNP